ncbi:hypothetical protein LOCC1_G007291 [Lachnellula occidentalis]|uniref:SMP domain-containing protein n=1 Tax=Lachnellula occidentalis TaxID=215460 RepID=A0A8H8RMY3_9HELO|nr:hypothetical protein LOCC1_G007291 [Lachnellula occidentalis]
MPNNHEMTKEVSQRVQSTQASIPPPQAKNGGNMSGNGFASRAQSTGDKHANSNNSAGSARVGGSGFNTSAGNAGNQARK